MIREGKLKVERKKHDEYVEEVKGGDMKIEKGLKGWKKGNWEQKHKR